MIRFLKIIPSILVAGKKDNVLDMGHKLGQILRYMKDSGKITVLMDRVE